MAWLHTWTGVCVGALLFAIFWMGTLSVFDREIDRWMTPETRIAATGILPSLDAIAETADAFVQPGAQQWQILLPTMREPVVKLIYRDANGTFVSRRLHPATAAPLPETGSLGASDFIFPFHYNLNLEWFYLGYWLVGLLGMAMLMMIVSGVIIHRGIFRNFFTFRPDRKLPRSSLDLHNLTAVVALPFHVVITLSGLIIFFSTHFPGIAPIVYHEKPVGFVQDAYGAIERAPLGIPAERASMDTMMARASQLWDGGLPYFVRIWHPGDANGYVEMRRSYTDAVTMNLDAIYFDGPSGAVLHMHAAKPVMSVQRFLSGIHFIQFEHWTLRWLYFALGLSGCVMIATGFVYWLEKRRKRHVVEGRAGIRIVSGLTIGSVTGIVIATLGFFVANRLLPSGTGFAGYGRAALEVWAFYLVWLATFAHAWTRPSRAWAEQSWIIAGFAVLAVVLNVATTGDHLARTLGAQHLRAVAGMDLMLLVAAAVAALTARRLQRRRLTGTRTLTRASGDAANRRA